jgi:integrase
VNRTGSARLAGVLPRRPSDSEVPVHDLRHTAASVWLGARADPKVVQRVLGTPRHR